MHAAGRIYAQPFNHAVTLTLMLAGLLTSVHPQERVFSKRAAHPRPRSRIPQEEKRCVVNYNYNAQTEVPLWGYFRASAGTKSEDVFHRSVRLDQPTATPVHSDTHTHTRAHTLRAPTLACTHSEIQALQSTWSYCVGKKLRTAQVDV